MAELYAKLDDVELGRDSLSLESAQLALDARGHELASEMAAKGFRPATDDDLKPTADRIDAHTLARTGGAGNVALPATVYSAPIVLTLTSTPAERRQLISYLVRLVPIWTSLMTSATLQLILAGYLDSAIVAEDSSSVVSTCGATTPLLRYSALVTFVALVVLDVVETAGMHGWLRALPSAETPEFMRLLRFVEKVEPPAGRSLLVLPVSGITRFERLAFYLLCLTPKFVVSIACLVAGSGAILRSASNFELVLATVAATFILELDDSLYKLLVPEASQNMASAMPEISRTGRTETVAGKSKTDYYERVKQLAQTYTIVIGLSIALSGFWCVSFAAPDVISGEPTEPTTLASDTAFAAILVVAIGLGVCLALVALFGVKSSGELLVESYNNALQDGGQVDIQGSSAAEALMGILEGRPDIAELQVSGTVEGILAFVEAVFAGSRTNLSTLKINGKDSRGVVWSVADLRKCNKLIDILTHIVEGDKPAALRMASDNGEPGSVITTLLSSLLSSMDSIPNECFKGYTSLSEVTIPSSVTSIGKEAFKSCSSLREVTIPSSVTSIGEAAFWNCSSLSEVTISSKTELGDKAFPETTKITRVD